jgi:hypothetical protein
VITPVGSAVTFGLIHPFQSLRMTVGRLPAQSCGTTAKLSPGHGRNYVVEDSTLNWHMGRVIRQPARRTMRGRIADEGHTQQKEGLVPGEVNEVQLSLYATSVLIRQGHRVRVAIAGHDGSVFARYPAQGNPVISVQRNNAYPSHVELPVMERE